MSVKHCTLLIYEFHYCISHLPVQHLSLLCIKPTGCKSQPGYGSVLMGRRLRTHTALSLSAEQSITLSTGHQEYLQAISTCLQALGIRQHFMPSSRGRRAQEQVGAASPCSHVSESCLDQARRAGWDEARQAPPGSGQQGEGETRLPGRLTHARSYQRHASPRKKHPMQQRACAAPGMQHLLQDYCKTRPACNPSSSCLAPALTVPGWDLGCLLQHQGTQEAPVSPPDPRTHIHPMV